MSKDPCSLPYQPSDDAQTRSHQRLQYLNLQQQQSHCVELVTEVPIAISLNGINHAVMMISPTDIEAFLLGFLLSEGMIADKLELHDLEWQWQGDAIVAEITLSQRANHRIRAHRRALAGRTGCGLCGVDSLSTAFPDLPSLQGAPLPPVEHFNDLRERVRGAQSQGGAMHAAFYLSSMGQLQLCCEDVGRHNALDKLIGQLMQQGIDTRGGVVLMTSRCSIELVQKTIRADLQTLVTLASPTTFAVALARKHRLNLIHLTQRAELRCYTAALGDN